MGQAIKSIGYLINNAILPSWSAAARLILVLAAMLAVLIVATTVAPGLFRW